MIQMRPGHRPRSDGNSGFEDTTLMGKDEDVAVTFTATADIQRDLLVHLKFVYLVLTCISFSGVSRTVGVRTQASPVPSMCQDSIHVAGRRMDRSTNGKNSSGARIWVTRILPHPRAISGQDLLSSCTSNEVSSQTAW